MYCTVYERVQNITQGVSARTKSNAVVKNAKNMYCPSPSLKIFFRSSVVTSMEQLSIPNIRMFTCRVQHPRRERERVRERGVGVDQFTHVKSYRY